MSDNPHTNDAMLLEDAIGIISSVVVPVTQTETTRLENALGCVNAAPIKAPYALPPFDNTAVDGYALRHQDLALPTLKIIGNSFAGEGFQDSITPGTAIHIATGAPLPRGADTVVMQEYCVVEGHNLRVTQQPARGAHIRRAGNDIATGDEAMPPAKRLNAGDIALLGALGLTEIQAIRPIRIGIASTGNEIRPAGSVLSAGQIIDTNGTMLKQLLSPWNCQVTLLGSIPDDRTKTDDFFHNHTAKFDLILTTGGVSVGKRDFIRDAIKELGKVHFWKIAIRPGRPVMFGTMGKCAVLALPGNPVSAFVTFHLVATQVIQALSGITPVLPTAYPVILGEIVEKEPHLRAFPRARLTRTETSLIATPYRDQSSNLISSLAQSDGFLDLPIGKTKFLKDETVFFIPTHKF